MTLHVEMIYELTSLEALASSESFSNDGLPDIGVIVITKIIKLTAIKPVRKPRTAAPALLSIGGRETQ